MTSAVERHRSSPASYHSSMVLRPSVAFAVLLLAAHMAAGAGFLEGAPVERRIELSGIDTIDIDAAHFTVEVLGDPDLQTVTVVSRMSTRFHAASTTGTSRSSGTTAPLPSRSAMTGVRCRRPR